jgi:hypothetical protein
VLKKKEKKKKREKNPKSQKDPQTFSPFLPFLLAQLGHISFFPPRPLFQRRPSHLMRPISSRSPLPSLSLTRPPTGGAHLSGSPPTSGRPFLPTAAPASRTAVPPPRLPAPVRLLHYAIKAPPHPFLSPPVTASTEPPPLPLMAHRPSSATASARRSPSPSAL